MGYWNDIMSNYITHRGPNGESVNDIIICIDDSGTGFLNENERYIIINPDGGNNDVMCIPEKEPNRSSHGDLNYYKWERFLNLHQLRENIINKI